MKASGSWSAVRRDKIVRTPDRLCTKCTIMSAIIAHRNDMMPYFTAFYINVRTPFVVECCDTVRGAHCSARAPRRFECTSRVMLKRDF